LFVDDEVELVRAVKKMLARLGYKVVEKTGPIEALAAFRKEPDKFDLLITDLTMPKMTGFELAEAVRRIRPAVPIIFCSGFSAAVTEEQIENYGMSNFVMKPIIKNNLALAIRSVLDKKE
jgi:CheY-like chemotaxis protein